MRYSFIFLVFAIFSCSKSKEFEATNGIPEWYLIENTNASEIYGSGSGQNKEDAVNTALISASGKVQTTISGVIRTETQIVNSNTSEQMQIFTQNEVQKLALSGYEITHVAFDNKQKIFYAEVKIEKPKLYNKKLTEFNAQTEELSTTFQQAKAGSIAEKLTFIKQFALAESTLKKEIILLYALNSNFPLKHEMAKITEYQAYKKNLLKNISFKIEGAETLKFEEQIKKAVRSKGFALNTGQSTGQNIILIKLYKEESKESGKIYDMFFSKNTVTIEMTDERRPISSKIIIFTGKSRIDSEHAYKESLNDLTTQISLFIEEIL
jgi:hypothetical protein